MGESVSQVEQVSVFIENRPGRLVEMLQCLEQREMNIEALSIADAPDFGIVRMIASDPGLAVQVLQEAGFTARTTLVLRVDVPNKPGGLVNAVAEPLAHAGMNVEYIYGYVGGTAARATVVVKVRDLELAEKALSFG